MPGSMGENSCCREKSQIISLSLGKQIQYILDYVLKQKSKRNIKLSLLMRHIQFSCNC